MPQQACTEAEEALQRADRIVDIIAECDFPVASNALILAAASLICHERATCHSRLAALMAQQLVDMVHSYIDAAHEQPRLH